MHLASQLSMNAGFLTVRVSETCSLLNCMARASGGSSAHLTVRRVKEIYGNLRRSAITLIVSVPVTTQSLTLSINFGEVAGLCQLVVAFPFVGQVRQSMDVVGLD